jgi:hypothetical protein
VLVSSGGHKTLPAFTFWPWSVAWWLMVSYGLWKLFWEFLWPLSVIKYFNGSISPQVIVTNAASIRPNTQFINVWSTVWFQHKLQEYLPDLDTPACGLLGAVCYAVLNCGSSLRESLRSTA